MNALALSPSRNESAAILRPRQRPNDLPWMRAALRVPLLWKLLGANLVLIAGAVTAHVAFPASSTAVQLGAALGLSFVVSATLVWLALRPLVQLEEIADRVSEGNFTERVPASPLADRDMARLSSTVNRLLDRVEADRARIHHLAGRSVRARDIERESVARELRDSMAQLVTAIGLQLEAARRSTDDPGVGHQLANTRVLVNQLTDEMRSVAETLYPGTLEEFGLRNALEALSRRVSRRSNLTVDVQAGMFTAVLSPQTASALYHVAEESLRNIEQHAQAKNICVRLQTNGHVLLEIEDDGRGMDMRLNDPLQAGLGLFSARAVLALCGGELQISSGPELGTRVVATVPSSTPTDRS